LLKNTVTENTEKSDQTDLIIPKNLNFPSLPAMPGLLLISLSRIYQENLPSLLSL